MCDSCLLLGVPLDACRGPRDRGKSCESSNIVTLLAWFLFVSCSILLLIVPRRFAPVPLLVGCCYMTMGQGINIGAASMPFYRMMLLVGMSRVVVKGERIQALGNPIDKIVAVLMAWLVLASFFHDGVLGSGPVYILGIIFNFAGAYFLIRTWCRDLSDASSIIALLAFILAPLALSMVAEKLTGKNPFHVFGGVPENVAFREGKLRAQGPFRHPILAGTVGAVCIPLFIGILRQNRLAGSVGIIAGTAMTLASASSGPMMSAIVSVCAVIMWYFRQYTRMARLSAVAAYIAAQIYWGEPGYYIMKRIDLSGGSTGYHRARLIESAFENFNEWWLFGTDFTRHWMPTGVSWSPYHADITNYYLAFAVNGGLAAMLLMIAILLIAFRWVGLMCIEKSDSPSEAFTVWCLGAGLFAHAATSISVSYFDQSLVFFWMNVALISGLYANLSTAREADVEDEYERDTEPPANEQLRAATVAGRAKF